METILFLSWEFNKDSEALRDSYDFTMILLGLHLGPAPRLAGDTGVANAGPPGLGRSYRAFVCSGLVRGTWAWRLCWIGRLERQSWRFSADRPDVRDFLEWAASFDKRLLHGLPRTS